MFIGALEKHPRFSLHCYTDPFKKCEKFLSWIAKTFLRLGIDRTDIIPGISQGNPWHFMNISGYVREPQASEVMMVPIPQAGIYEDVAGVEAALATAHIEDVRITAKQGQKLVPLPEGASYLGFIFAR